MSALKSLFFSKKEYEKELHQEVTKSKNVKKRPYRHACSICTKKFTSIFCLEIHNRTHTGEQPFKCTVCEKRFTNNSHLTRHEIIHTGDKSFECSGCKQRVFYKYWIKAT